MLLVVEKDIRGEICHVIHQYVKANNKYMKDHDKNKETVYLDYCNLNTLYRHEQLVGFKWDENTPQSSKDFIENYNEDGDKGYFLEVYDQYHEKLHDFPNDLPFLP